MTDSRTTLLTVITAFDAMPRLLPAPGDVRWLIGAYRTDPDSPFHSKRFHTRAHYVTLCDRIDADMGDRRLTDLKARELLHWNGAIVTAGHIPMAHALVGMVRTLTNFGATILESAECERIAGILHKMRFKMGKPRNERLTAEQAVAIRAMAWKVKLPSIAMAQAFQFECMMRQKDVIGEWVPVSEPGDSDTFDGGMKWLRGIRWEEISDDFILTHITSKRQKEIVVDLKLAPMVIEELNYAMGLDAIGGLQRSKFPATGPVIDQERDLLPWTGAEYRRQWRKIATACGIPKTVKSMDTRAGAITEATEAGAPMESIKHAATHSQISMTEKYARAPTEKTADVSKLRVAHRNSKAVG